MSEIKFTGIRPNIESGWGEAYEFTYRGEDYYVECWATRNAGGQDIYRASDGAAVMPFSPDEEAEFEQKLEDIQGAYAEAWERRVRAPLELAITEAVAQVNQEVSATT